MLFINREIQLDIHAHDFFLKWFSKTGRRTFANTKLVHVLGYGVNRVGLVHYVPVNRRSFRCWRVAIFGWRKMEKDLLETVSIPHRSETPFSYYCDNLIHGDLVYRVGEDFLNKDTISNFYVHMYIKLGNL